MLRYTKAGTDRALPKHKRLGGMLKHIECSASVALEHIRSDAVTEYMNEVMCWDTQKQVQCQGTTNYNIVFLSQNI